MGCSCSSPKHSPTTIINTINSHPNLKVALVTLRHHISNEIQGTKRLISTKTENLKYEIFKAVRSSGIEKIIAEDVLRSQLKSEVLEDLIRNVDILTEKTENLLIYLSDQEKIAPFTPIFQRLFFTYYILKYEIFEKVIKSIEKGWILKDFLNKYHEKQLIPDTYLRLSKGEISNEELSVFLDRFYLENNMKPLLNS